MLCAACGHDNTGNRRLKFCGECGAPLVSAPAPAGERRKVAILFADLAGYTRLSSSLDPEEVHRLLAGFFEVVDGVCARYGGTIDKHIGDNVMSVFGAPIAHGDDPERAVRAAVDIHREVAGYSTRVGRELLVHVGIAYGEVIASGLGSAHHHEYTVTGDAVNLAARLQDKAVGGETMISDPVRKAAERIALVEPVGEVAVKGLAAPVPAWRLTGVRAAAPARRVLVGRDTELARVAAALTSEDTAGLARGCAVVLRGDPGIGKSALTAAVVAGAAERGVAVLSACVLDFGAGRGEGAVPTLAAGLLGGTVADAVAAGRIDAADAGVLTDLLELDAVEGRRDDLDPVTRRERQRAVLAALVGSRTQSTLAVVEDLHWADAVTRRQLRELVADLLGHGDCVLLTTRLDADPIDAAWREILGERLVIIDLEPLAPEAAAALAATRLEDGALVARCVARAGGNPLFLEQLVLGVADGELPGTLQALVLARVDRLPARDKRALQAASAGGQRCSLELVRHLAGDPTYDATELLARRLLREQDGELVFHHALILDGVYASLTHARRRELHRAAAGYFARDPEPRAMHLDRAGDPGAAAAWLAAAQHRAALHDPERAEGFIARGLAAATTDLDRHHLHTLDGTLRVEAGDAGEAAAPWRAAIDTAPDEPARCRALIGLASAYRVMGRPLQALPVLDQAEGLARTHDLALERVQIAYYRGSAHFFTEPDLSRRAHEHARDGARELGAREWEVRALSGLADSAYSAGDVVAGIDRFGDCVALFDALELRRPALPNRAMLAECLLYALRGDEARAIATDVARVAAEIHHGRAEVLAINCLANLDAHAPDDRSELRLQEALACCRRYGLGMFAASVAIQLAESRLRRGDRAGASAAARAIVDENALDAQRENDALGALLRALAEEAPVDQASAVETMLDRPAFASVWWWLGPAHELALAAGADALAERCRSTFERLPHQPPLVSLQLRLSLARAQLARGDASPARAAEVRGLLDRLASAGFTVDAT